MAKEQEYTSITLMLIPAGDDPIVAASSEPAHMTTVWMGESADLSDEQVAAIVAEAQAYAASLDGPVTVPVVERGELGDEGADVAFLEATDSLLALRNGLLDASPTITEAMNSVEQFPDWTPHVTLGYPESPALEEYAGEAVTFDRLGVWVATERHNFEMGGVMADEITAAAVAVVEDDEMPLDVPEEGEELITEIPVHGVMTIEGRPTGDGRGFREGGLSFGPLPAPLGFEFESGHGSDNSWVAVVGRIDTFEVVEANGVREARWTGAIMPGKPYAGQALEGIIDGSYTGASVIVDDITVDVEEEKLRLRSILTSSDADGDKSFAEMTPEEIDAFIEETVGDGKQPVTWFSEARIRRFDMVPTGAFPEAYMGLGHEFEEDLTPEQIEASVQALADCGCLEGTEFEDLSSDPLANARAAVDHYLFESGFRQISSDERKKLADEGKALPDGSFPIVNVDDLKNAIQAIGRAKDPAAAKAHIKKRAKDLGQEGLIPEGWSLHPDDSILKPGDHAHFGTDLAYAPADVRERIEAWEATVPEGYDFAPGTHDGPGWITHPIPTARIRRYWVRGKGAAKIRWGVPGDFNRCRMQLAKYVQNPDWLAGLCANMHKEAIGVWPGQETGRHSLVASAGVERAPLFSLTAALEPIDIAYFQRRELENPRVGVVVEGDAFYGYIAQWSVCHIGEPDGPGSCTMAPRSATGYAQYRTGTIMTTEGPIATGPVTMGTGHAGGRLQPHAAVEHYDNTGSVIGDVVCGEDQFGIWFAGKIRPTATDDQIFALAASGRLSGDWRRIGGNYELVAALVVNVPGFPIPEVSLAASAGFGLSLVAAGVLPPDAEDVPVESAATATDVAAIAIAAVEHFILAQKRAEAIEQAAPARKIIAAHTLAYARERVAALVKE